MEPFSEGKKKNLFRFNKKKNLGDHRIPDEYPEVCTKKKKKRETQKSKRSKNLGRKKEIYSGELIKSYGATKKV